MKLFIVFLLLGIKGWGQKNLDSLVSVDLCGCLTSIDNPSYNDLTKCAEFSMKKNSEEIIKKTIPQGSDLSEEESYGTGYQAGQSIFKRISISMVNTCSAYFRLMDTLRYLSIKELSPDTLSYLIRQLDYTPKEKRGSEFYITRGKLFFQNFMFDKALIDIDSALKFNKDSQELLFYKAWALELTKKYDEAILIYNDLAIKTEKDKFYLMAAIAKRKKSCVK